MPLSRAGGAGLEGGILRAFPIFYPRLCFSVALTRMKSYFGSYFGVLYFYCVVCQHMVELNKKGGRVYGITKTES